LIVAFCLAILGGFLLVPQNHQVVLIEIGPAGPKLWIMTRMLQMGVGMPANLFSFASLLVHGLGVVALSWPVRRESAARGRMRIALVGMAAIGLIYWLVIALGVSKGRISDDVKSPALACATLPDLVCVVLANLLIAGIAYRGGHTRIGRSVHVLSVVQGGGLLLLFSAIYFRNSVAALGWPSLLLHAAGGSGLTIIALWLIVKLAGAAKAVRAGVLLNDEEIQRGLK